MRFWISILCMVSTSCHVLIFSLFIPPSFQYPLLLPSNPLTSSLNHLAVPLKERMRISTIPWIHTLRNIPMLDNTRANHAHHISNNPRSNNTTDPLEIRQSEACARGVISNECSLDLDGAGGEHGG